VTGSELDRRRRFGRYLARMERSEFWLAHEELEALWLEQREPGLKGLIHLAAALVHAERGNRRGALTKAESCLELVGQSDEIMGLRLGHVRALAMAIAGWARDGEGAAFEVPEVPMSTWYREEIDPADLEEVELPYRVRRYDEGYRTGRDPGRRD
jgi:hypothetical protein